MKNRKELKALIHSTLYATWVDDVPNHLDTAIGEFEGWYDPDSKIINLIADKIQEALEHLFYELELAIRIRPYWSMRWNAYCSAALSCSTDFIKAIEERMPEMRRKIADKINESLPKSNLRLGQLWPSTRNVINELRKCESLPKEEADLFRTRIYYAVVSDWLKIESIRDMLIDYVEDLEIREADAIKTSLREHDGFVQGEFVEDPDL